MNSLKRDATIAKRVPFGTTRVPSIFRGNEELLREAMLEEGYHRTRTPQAHALI
jgi:hypothetical protein